MLILNNILNKTVLYHIHILTLRLYQAVIFRLFNIQIDTGFENNLGAASISIEGFNIKESELLTLNPGEMMSDDVIRAMLL